MICPKCKNKVERGAGYCPNCGTQLKNDGKSKNEDQIEKSSKKKKIVILGSLMAVIVIAAICFWVIVSRNNNQNEKLTKQEKTHQDSKADEIHGKEGESKNIDEKKISVEHILNARVFKDGIAFILFDTGEKQYKGFVNESGVLQFYVPIDNDADNDEIYAFNVDFENGYNWFEYSNTFYVIDQKGAIKSKYNSEDVVSYGAGYTWIVSEENESWNDAGIHKYTLYNPLGEEVTSYSIENEYMDRDDFGITYIGEGIFAYEMMDTEQEMEEPEKVCRIYDTNVSKTSMPDVDFEELKDAGVSDGLIVMAGTEDGNWPNADNPVILKVIKDGEFQEIQVSGSDMDGAESDPSLLGWSEKYVLYTIEIDGKSQLWIYNLNNASAKKYMGTFKEYITDYRGAEGNVDGNIIVAKISGADGKDYICMINVDSMEEVGDPILTEGFEEFYLEDGALEIDTEEGTDIYNLQNEKQASFENYLEIMDIGDNILTVKNKESEGRLVAWKHWDGTTLFDEIETSTSRELTKAKVMK